MMAPESLQPATLFLWPPHNISTRNHGNQPITVWGQILRGVSSKDAGYSPRSQIHYHLESMGVLLPPLVLKRLVEFCPLSFDDPSRNECDLGGAVQFIAGNQGSYKEPVDPSRYQLVPNGNRSLTSGQSYAINGGAAEFKHLFMGVLHASGQISSCLTVIGRPKRAFVIVASPDHLLQANGYGPIEIMTPRPSEDPSPLGRTS
jgi:hypothetical protein